jgi:hypothetical protein
MKILATQHKSQQQAGQGNRPINESSTVLPVCCTDWLDFLFYFLASLARTWRNIGN